jgi:hypothetical protein
MCGIVFQLFHTRLGTDLPTYFLGTISIRTFHLYFPALYLTKEPLPLHVLTLLALCSGAARLIHAGTTAAAASAAARIRSWVHQHFFEFRALLRLTILDGGLILTSSYRGAASDADVSFYLSAGVPRDRSMA